jgi:hypothetical protein
MLMNSQWLGRMQLRTCVGRVNSRWLWCGISQTRRAPFRCRVTRILQQLLTADCYTRCTLLRRGAEGAGGALSAPGEEHA